MNEFDKWVYSRSIRPAYTTAAQKEGWKAALEWVMETAMNHYGNDFMTDMPMNKLYNSIKEELED